MTRGELLRHALAFALRSLRFKRAPLGPAETDRYRLAEEAIAALRKQGRWRSWTMKCRTLSGSRPTHDTRPTRSLRTIPKRWSSGARGTSSDEASILFTESSAKESSGGHHLALSQACPNAARR
jgi:hypothetical protein